GMPNGGMPPDVAQYAHHDVWYGPSHLVALLLFAILIGVLVWGVLRITSQRTPALAGVGAPVGLPPALPPRDHAHEELRVRYARGEIERTDYLQRAADLGIAEIGTTGEPHSLPGSPPDQQE
ncbi:MAG: hypothetical protein ABJB55_07350, partial [Actinomycetota bacterium]